MSAQLPVRIPRYGDALITAGHRRRVTGLYEPTQGDVRVCYAVGIDTATVPLASVTWDDAGETWRSDATPEPGSPGQVGAFE